MGYESTHRLDLYAMSLWPKPLIAQKIVPGVIVRLFCVHTPSMQQVNVT